MLALPGGTTQLQKLQRNSVLFNLKHRSHLRKVPGYFWMKTEVTCQPVLNSCPSPDGILMNPFSHQICPHRPFFLMHAFNEWKWVWTCYIRSLIWNYLSSVGFRFRCQQRGDYVRRGGLAGGSTWQQLIVTQLVKTTLTDWLFFVTFCFCLYNSHTNTWSFLLIFVNWFFRREVIP